MITTAIIAFREFLEAFLIVGVFIGISRQLRLKKEIEIILAAGVGIITSLIIASGLYIFGNTARRILTEKNADSLESYLLIFSGFFIAYVVFSLHKAIRRGRGTTLISAHKKLQNNAFDLSLFLTIIFLVVREGFEVALFTASVSLFSSFSQNFLGLLIGFAAACFIGVLTYFAYLKFPISKIFRVTEYSIIVLGASLVQLGLTKLFVSLFNINLSLIGSLNFGFLPPENNIFAHLLRSFFGIDREFSLMRLMIMAIYIYGIYYLFLREKKTTNS